MKKLIFILFLIPLVISAQSDRIYLMNGKIKEGNVVSVGLKSVFVKLSDSSYQTLSINKSDILLIEKYDGKVLVFGHKENGKNEVVASDKVKQHSISFEPINVAAPVAGSSANTRFIGVQP